MEPTPSVVPSLVRQNTISFAKMKPHATFFNDAINLKKNEWDSFVTNLNSALFDAANNPANLFYNLVAKCVGNRFIISQTGEKSSVIGENIPKIFMLGGAAYSAYGTFFANMGHHTMETVAPRTHDWDIIICVNVLNEETEKTFGLEFIKFLEENIGVFEQSYLERFQDLDSNVGDIDNREQVAYVHPSKKFEITVLRNKNYINLRLNMAILMDGRKTKTHVIEFVLWGPSSQFYDGISEINILTTSNGLNYMVPIISDLVLLTTRGIINRGKRPGVMAKCRQDFARLKYLCEALNLSDELSELLKKGNSCNIASEILSFLRQCSAELSDEQFKAIGEEASSLSDISEIAEKIETNLSPMLDERQKILFYPKAESSSYYETKYLKYKQKYLALKEKLKQK